MARLLTYAPKDTWIHRLSGVTKMLFFILWSVAGMLTYDTRILVVMLLFSLVIFKVSKTEWKQVGTVFKFILLFLCMNIVIVYLFSPYEGCSIYGSRTELFHIAGRYSMTAEQLFYELNIMLKYFTVVPVVLMFMVTTNPSEFAASLNRIGVSYKAAYALALTLRYFPDMIRDYQDISLAQQSRGLDLSKKEKLGTRVKNMMNIFVPLIFTTLDRIELISNAMDLRGFGKHKKRTWYAGKPLGRNDYLAMLFSAAVLAGSICVSLFVNGSRFYNPFV